MAYCHTCGNGLRIPESEPVHEDEHGRYRVCPDCGGSANVAGTPYTEPCDIVPLEEATLETYIDDKPYYCYAHNESTYSTELCPSRDVAAREPN